ncbi:MAG: hypothetical protein K0R21_190 [Anaerocolumna sp.]|jgi:hypothetical protein|nr:hypothetical protein [Anaerocolumna sp.]
MRRYSPALNSLESYILFTLANSGMTTLVKLKPSSLITFYKKQIIEKTNFFALLEVELNKFQCLYKVLYESSTAYFVLIYAPSLLENVLAQNRNYPLLINNGYNANDVTLEKKLEQLILRYHKSNLKAIDFPHEIGIFLGYPLYDVEGFIANKGENYILNGYWKVYHNMEEARNIFRNYNEVREKAVCSFFANINK